MTRAVWLRANCVTHLFGGTTVHPLGLNSRTLQAAILRGTLLGALSWFPQTLAAQAEAPIAQPAPAVSATDPATPPADASATTTDSAAPAVVDEPEWPAPAWLMTPEQATEFKKFENQKITAAKRAQSPSTADKELLRKYVGYYASMLTFDDDTELPKDVTEKLTGTTEILNQFTSEASRNVMLEDVLIKVRDLLNHPKPIVRLNAVYLVVNLSTKLADQAKGTPPVPYLPAKDLLIEIVQDSNQMLQARIPAIVGLDRILTAGTPNPGDRAAIAVALCNALDQLPVSGNDGIRWTRVIIAEALGKVDEFGNPQAQGRPIAFEKLLGILVNRQETYQARAEAVMAISRLPLGNTANLPLVINETLQLVKEMSETYPKKMEAPVWKIAYSRVYFAFRPESQQRADRNIGFLFQIRRSGLGAHTAMVEAAFAVVLPIFRAVGDSIPSLPIPASAEKALAKFLTDYPVVDRRPTPGSAPVGDVNGAPANPANPGNASDAPKQGAGE